MNSSLPRNILQCECAMSEIIATIMLLAIAVSMIALIQTESVPQWNKELEMDHLDVVYDDFMKIRSDIEDTALFQFPKSSQIHMGVNYPDRLIFVNPADTSGTLTSNNNTWIQVTFTPPNGTQTSIYASSSTITFEPNYNYYTNAPLLVYENGLIIKDFTINNFLYTDTDQTMFTNDAINILSLNYTNESESFSGLKVLNYYPRYTNSTENNTNVTVTFFTHYPRLWDALLKKGNFVYAIHGNTINVFYTGATSINIHVINGSMVSGIWVSATFIAIPPPPVSLMSTQGNFWINYTWQPGIGNFTDSYYVNVNGVWSNASGRTYHNDTVGPHGWSNMTVWAYNNSGSLSLSAVSQNTQVLNNLPVISPTGNQNITAGNLLQFDVNATDLDNDTLVFSTNATKGSIDPATGIYSWQTSLNESGTYVWSFNLSDGYGGTSGEVITIIVNPVPIYTPPAPVNLAKAQGNFWINYTWNAGIGNVTNSYNVTQNGTWTNGSANNMNKTVGPHGWSNITVYAYNTSGTGTLNSTSISSSTQLANNLPVLAPIGDKSVEERNVLSFTISATDAENDPIIYSTNAQGTLNPITGVYSWTPSETGIYTVWFKSTDTYAGSDSETITITVNE